MFGIQVGTEQSAGLGVSLPSVVSLLNLYTVARRNVRIILDYNSHIGLFFILFIPMETGMSIP